MYKQSDGQLDQRGHKTEKTTNLIIILCSNATLSFYVVAIKLQITL